MKFNILTHITPHISKYEAGCKCCGKYRQTAFLPLVIEDLRQHVWDDLGQEYKVNVHYMGRCLSHNRSLGKWKFDNKEIARATVASKSGLNIANVNSIIARADRELFKKLENLWGIIWVPDSYDGSRHAFLPENFHHDSCPDHVKAVLRTDEESCAVDFDMKPLTPAQIADYIQIVMSKYNCNYAVLQYNKPLWTNPGVHFDVDTTRTGIVSKVM